MNGVIGITGLILDTALDADQREFAESHSHQRRVLLTIVNDILDFSGIQKARAAFELEILDCDIR